MKNPNGFGTVYKISKKGRRKPWVAKVTVGWEIVTDKKTGKEKTKQITQPIGYFEEKNEALDALVLYRINPISPKASITLRGLYDEWSEAKFEYISKPTQDNYKAGWKYLAKFEKIKFKELRTAHLQSVIDQCRKKGMSRSTMEKIKAVATMLYDYAIQNDIINKNYAEFIKLPKTDKEEKEIFSDLELRTLEKHADTMEWVDTILILIYTGMRISEMFDLTKFNVNLEKKVIAGGIKTEAGKNRTIPIHPKIQKYIQKWYDKNGDYLICNSNGGRLHANNYRNRRYYPVLEKLEIRKLNPHCCRHTFASLLRKAGADTKSIQKLVGHAKYSTTADIYTHTDIEELKIAVNKI